ncbi:hypothetical protein BS47DRAFT_1489931 [Hydnum rufescens UP504]|uniref:Uncharacterized protein n=1 Tax=Hydnum rufescens UP504 TaxID=1448309 RepID=A0A9P6DNA9_9AGAM|nr:hypothetical protein BS47DRAFT_1489931 [Hydnum rufescens UP504]
MFSASKVPRFCFQSHSRLPQFRHASSMSRPSDPPFIVTYKKPKDASTVTTSFDTLDDFRSYFRGWLFTNPVTDCSIVPARMNYSHADSTVIYLADHPLYTAHEQGTRHHQISDKAFEEKAIKAIERHLFLRGGIRRFVAKDPARPDGWRYLTGETDIAEWDGSWEGPDGRVYFLEIKHFVDADKIAEANRKLEKSLKFLGKSAELATVYVAGKYWSTKSSVVNLAQTLGFGIVEENGTDLEVKHPVRGLQVGRNSGKQVVVVEGKKRGRPRKVKP